MMLWLDATGLPDPRGARTRRSHGASASRIQSSQCSKRLVAQNFC